MTVLQNRQGGITPRPRPPQMNIQVTADGQLQLPYDQKFSEAQFGAVADANDQLVGLKSEQDQYNLDYTGARRDADLQYNQLKSQTLNANSARGSALSSAYGTAVANNANQYARTVGDMQAKKTQFDNDITARRAAIQNSLNRQISSSSQSYADSLGQKAGTLGYGGKVVPPVGVQKPIGAKKPAPKRRPGSEGRPVVRKGKGKGRHRKAAQRALRNRRG